MRTFSPSDLGPVFQQFDWIRQIPRPSTAEGPILEVIEDRAAAAGCGVQRDGKNLYVYVPATARSARRMCLMAHADMVCEVTQDCPYDPKRDAIPIALWSEDARDYLVAQGFESTLGADNGIGLAMIMELATNRSLPHPALDLLITVEEETGLNGAKCFEPSLVQADTGINLDSEQEGTQTVATAGMCYSLVSANFPGCRAASHDRSLNVTVSGLRGGHSGLDIHSRVSALTALCDALWAACKSFDFVITSLSGGTAGNTIPIAASADLAIASAVAQDCAELLRRVGQQLLSRFGERSAVIDVQISIPTSDGTGWHPLSVLNLLRSIPVGALSFNKELPGQPVAQSNNVWRVESSNATLRVHCSSRAMSDSGLDEVLQKLEAVAGQNEASFDIVPESRFPPWEPRPDSPIQKAIAASYRRLFHKPMQSLAVHGGLELSVIQANFRRANRPFDATSIGPTILGAHTVRERVDIDSANRVFQLLCRVLREW